MPDTVSITVPIDPPCRPALFDDGQERITLNLPLEAMLERPTHRGWCTIYGMSHELGHMAMYRLLPQQRAGWMSHGAAESWALTSVNGALSRLAHMVTIATASGLSLDKTAV